MTTQFLSVQDLGPYLFEGTDWPRRVTLIFSPLEGRGSTLSQVKDLTLAPSGRMKMEWAREHMPVLAKITKRLVAHKTFTGYKIGTCLHLEAKTAALGESIHRSSAERAISCNNRH